jgi:hypothetical protein
MKVHSSALLNKIVISFTDLSNNDKKRTSNVKDKYLWLQTYYLSFMMV